MTKTLREVATDVLNKKIALEEGAVPQEPMHSIAKDESDKDEQGEQDLGKRVDSPDDGKTGSAKAGEGVKGRVAKRPADNNANNDPMQSLPSKIDGKGQGDGGMGPGKFPARPADATSKDDPMQSLPDQFTTKGKGPKDIKEEAPELNIDEDIEALFNGEELSEEFKAKAKTIFEAAVFARVKAFETQITEAFEAQLEEEITSLQEELSTNVDDYLNYVVEQWVQDNEVAIESGLRTELTEDFITGLRNLFIENYIDVPEEEVNVIDEMVERNQELEEKLNEEIAKNIELTKSVNESLKEANFLSLTRDLTDTQVEKLRELSEGVEFVSEEDFENKLTTIYENYYPTKPANKATLEEKGEPGSKILAEDVDDAPKTRDPMDKYVRSLSKTSIS